MDATTPAGNAPQTLAERMDAYIAEHKITLPAFGALCGVSSSTLYKVRDGRSVAPRVEGKISAFLDGKLAAEQLSSPLPVLDEASRAMANAVIDLATQNERHLALINATFRMIKAELGEEVAETVAAQVLWAYLAGVDDPEVRVKKLFELHDAAKPD